MQAPLAVSWFLTAVLLAACASPSRLPPGNAAPPDLSAVGAPTASPPAAGAARDDGGRARSAGFGGWSKPGASREQRAADSEACYRFAWAQVANDVRIDDDISAARDDVGSYQSRFGELTRRVDSHYYSREHSTRFEDCMRSKGYNHG